MAKRRVPGPLPSKQEILDYIRDSDRPVGRREIARAFQIKGADRAALRAILSELADEGLIDKGRRRRVMAQGPLPEVAMLEVSDVDFDGELFAKPLTWQGDEPPPRIVLLPSRRRVAAPKKGDRVLARLRRVDDTLYEASPIRVLGQAPRTVVGIAEDARGGLMVRPTDRRISGTFFVANEQRGDTADGDVVVIEGLPGRADKVRPARVVERIAQADDPRSFSLIAIHAQGIPVAFPEDALKEAETLKSAPANGREDLRGVPLVTIDDATARDFDDAVWAEADTAPDNPGGWRLIVAIADVAHYVRPGRALDRAARERGNSVYFPDRVVPMLPERLSNNLCSLRPDEDRACVAVEMRITASGRLTAHRFKRAVMRSAARLTYRQVQDATDGRPDDTTGPLVETVIKPLYGAFRALAKARDKRGTLDLDIPERVVTLGEDGHIDTILPRPRLDSHRLIEEFMIAANVAAAETLQTGGLPVMYRVHEPPSLAKLEALRESLDAMGFKLAKGIKITPRLFKGILAKAAQSDSAAIVSELILRSQAQAVYASENQGHFGLALVRYCHFTSPIRRYSDVLVHRALISAAGLKTGRKGDGLSEEDMTRFDETAEHISRTERRASAAERDALDRYTTSFLADRVGAVFSGRINGVTRFGLFVTLDETGADGLIPVSTLPWDRYDHDEVHHALVGQETGLVYRLGERVKVELAEADTITGGMVFHLISGGTTADELDIRPRGRGRTGRSKAAGRRGPRGKGRSARRR